MVPRSSTAARDPSRQLGPGALPRVCATQLPLHGVQVADVPEAARERRLAEIREAEGEGEGEGVWPYQSSLGRRPLGRRRYLSQRAGLTKPLVQLIPPMTMFSRETFFNATYALSRIRA